jgi:hypothetical protein
MTYGRKVKQECAKPAGTKLSQSNRGNLIVGDGFKADDCDAAWNPGTTGRE